MDVFVHYVKKVEDVHFQETGVLTMEIRDDGAYYKGGAATIFVWPEDLSGFVESLEEALLIMKEKLPVEHKGDFKECRSPDCIAAFNLEHRGHSALFCITCVGARNHNEIVNRIAE